MARTPQIAETAARGVQPSAQYSPRSASSSDFGGQIGAAVQDLGQGLEGVSRGIENLELAKAADQRRLRDFTLETNFLRFQTEEAARLAEAQQEISGGGWEFQKNFVMEHAARAEDWLVANDVSDADEQEMARWRQRQQGLFGTLSSTALGAEFQERDRFYAEEIGVGLDTIKTGINQNPEGFDDYVQQGQRLIEMSGLGAGAKDSALLRWEQQAATAYGQALVQQNASVAMAALGGPVTVAGEGTVPGGDNVSLAFDVLLVAEGGLGPNGEPLTSSAGARGVAQVMEGTGPEAARLAGVPWDREKWANDTAYNRRLGEAYFAEQVKTFGGDVRKGWAAYNAGPRWVSAAVERAAGAAPGTPQADWFWQLNNDGRTAANQRQTRDYVEKNDRLYAQRGGSANDAAVEATTTQGEIDPRLANLPYDARMQLMGAAARGIEQGIQQRAQAAQAAQAAQINALELSIIDGTAGAEDIQAARDAGVLNDATDLNRLNNLVEARDQKNADLNAFSAAWADPTFAWNPYDPDQRDAVDAAFQANEGGIGALQGIVDRTGIVPPSAATAMRGALLSNDPMRVGQAASVASNIIARQPNAFTALEGGRDIEQAAVMRDYYINTLGLSAQDAATRLAADNDPQRAGQLRPDEQRRTTFNTTVRTQVTPQAIVNALPGANGRILAASQSQAIMQDYAEIAADNFARYGDEGAARHAAQREINRLYGISSNGTFTKYPPEKVYPPDAEGTHNYIYEQASQSVRSQVDGDITARDVFLVPLPTVTAEAWRQGQRPAYSIGYRFEQDGQTVYAVLPGGYRFNPPARQPGMTGAQAAADTRRARETARFRQNAIGAMIP